jgi:anti-anti-sigma regulatory factor
LCAVIQQRGQDIILDLSGVTAIDAAGIGALVSLQVAGTYLRLVGPSLAVRQVLRLTSLDSVFEISESECSEETVGLEPQKARKTYSLSGLLYSKRRDLSSIDKT